MEVRIYKCKDVLNFVANNATAKRVGIFEFTTKAMQLCGTLIGAYWIVVNDCNESQDNSLEVFADIFQREFGWVGKHKLHWYTAFKQVQFDKMCNFSDKEIAHKLMDNWIEEMQFKGEVQ